MTDNYLFCHKFYKVYGLIVTIEKKDKLKSARSVKF